MSRVVYEATALRAPAVAAAKFLFGPPVLLIFVLTSLSLAALAFFSP